MDIKRKKCQQLIQKDGAVCECSRYATHFIHYNDSVEISGEYICRQHVKYILKFSPNVHIVEMQGC